MTIQTVLFDADGVTQYNWVFMERMSKLLNGRATLEEVSDVEHPNLTGERDFDAELRAFVAEKGIDAQVEDMYAIWNDIEFDPEVLAMMAELRAKGVDVYLATNQQPERGPVHGRPPRALPRRHPPVPQLADALLAKPDPAFFRAIIDELASTRRPRSSWTTSRPTWTPPVPSASTPSSTTAPRAPRASAASS